LFHLRFLTIGSGNSGSYGSGQGSGGYRVDNGAGGNASSYGYNPGNNLPNYIRPIPYSNVSQYIAPHQYHDYAKTLHSFYNVPYHGGHGSYDSTGGYSNFKMVVAVAVISGLLGTPSNPLLRGTLYISEIYPQICLVSGVVSG
jgi:hypothetical protein